MLHSDPLEQTAISPWAFPLLKMSKPTEQRATIVDKYRFCFTHLNLRFPLKLRRVCSAFFLLSDGLALKSHAHCQMGKRLHGQKERAESIRKWQLFSCARGAGQLPGLVAKVTGSSANMVQRAAVGSDGGGRVEDDGWDVGQEERAESWWVRVMQFKCKQRALQTALTEPLNHWTSLWSVSSLHDASQTVTQLPQLLTASRSLMTEYFVVKTCVFEHYLLWGNALILYWSWIFMSFFFLRNIIFNPSVHRFWSRQSRNLSENEWQRFVEHVVCAN